MNVFLVVGILVIVVMLRSLQKQGVIIMATQQEVLAKLAEAEERAAAAEAHLDEIDVTLDAIQADVTALTEAAQGGNLDEIMAAAERVTNRVTILQAKSLARRDEASGIDSQTPPA